LHYILHFI